MMTRLFLAVVEISVTMGLVAAALLVLLPLLNRRFAAKWSYAVWIFLAVRLLLPVSGETAAEFVQRTATALFAKEETAAPVMPVRRIVLELPAQVQAPVVAAPSGEKGITPLAAAAAVWLAGCVLYLVFSAGSYLVYRRKLLKCTHVCEDAELLEELKRLKGELRVKRRLPVMLYDGTISPMIMGVFRPVLVLPDIRCGDAERYYILKHELVHFKRHDVAVKLLFLAACAVHWFNPFIHLMQKRAIIDMEISCDERVIRGIAYADRKDYTETLFLAVQAACGKRTYFSTQFYGGKEIMKKRFQNIFTRVRKKNGLPVLAGAVALTLAAGLFVGCGVGESDGLFGAVIVKTGAEDKQGGGQAGMSDEELCELAKQYFAVRHGGMTPQFAVIDGVTDEGLVKIWLYDMAEDGTVAQTLDWYTVDRATGVGEDVNFEPVNLLERAAQKDEPTEEEMLYAQMAGTWVVDLERTENLWGSGISYGSELALARDGYGSFSYYIGVGVGGTGKCEVEGDALKVEVEPYEDNREGTEVLTLRYVQEDGSEWILMDWYGEDVYWKRALSGQQPEAETTLTFMKEGQEEKKQAALTYGDGFALYLPVGEWQMTAPDQWTSTGNEWVSIWATYFPSQTADEARAALNADGYSFEGDVMMQENGDVVLRIRFFTAGKGVWGVFYRYPVDAEEGFGRELPVIVDTFMAVDALMGIDAAPASGEYAESEALSRTAEAFAAAYFDGDADALRTYLAATFEGDAETYPGPGKAELLAVRGLGTDEALAVGSERELSVEFRDSTEDSYTYLTLSLVKQEDGWKVQAYGLEK